MPASCAIDCVYVSYECGAIIRKSLSEAMSVQLPSRVDPAMAGAIDVREQAAKSESGRITMPAIAAIAATRLCGRGWRSTETRRSIDVEEMPRAKSRRAVIAAMRTSAAAYARGDDWPAASSSQA